VFVQRPISASLLAMAAIAILAMTLPNLRKGKDVALAG
jgi:TctA family transporter